jgi:hypothetical protein
MFPCNAKDGSPLARGKQRGTSTLILREEFNSGREMSTHRNLTPELSGAPQRSDWQFIHGASARTHVRALRTLKREDHHLNPVRRSAISAFSFAQI